MKFPCRRQLLPHKMKDVFTPSLHPFHKHMICNGVSPSLQLSVPSLQLSVPFIAAGVFLGNQHRGVSLRPCVEFAKLLLLSV